MRKTLGSPDHERFLELLVQTRRDAGLTQLAVAERLERPQSFVAKYENGERRLDVLEFIAVARALGADPVALLDTFVSAGSRRSRMAGRPSARRPRKPRSG
jgi:transcriptional regulator with XRE-family HTH domain